MYKDLENQKFDFLILGTNLTESALSAFLAKSKYKIIQADISKSYGGDCKNFNLRDMENFMKELSEKTLKDNYLSNITLLTHDIKKEIEPVLEKENYRQYNFDLNPKFLYARSKSSSELIDSKASNYIEFNSIRKIYFMYDDKFLNVPFSKSEIFISNDLDLLEKQKLLNFIFSVMKLKNNNVDVNSTVDIKKDIELDDDFLYNEIKKNLNEKANEFLVKHFNNKIIDMILLILSNQNLNNKDMTVDQMCDQIYKFLISVQIYDNTPFLIPQYGSSEFTQAMSRLSAVNGSIFLINDLLEFDVKYNKEKKDEKSGNFLVEVLDGEKNEKFNINVDKIIVNNCFLDNDKLSKVKLEQEIKNKIKNSKENNYIYKYTAFYSIKAIGQLFSIKEGPHYYRVPKNNTFIKNEYQLDAIKYFNNTCVVPNNRTLLYITIFSDLNEKDENIFIEKAKIIAENFSNKIINDMKEDINKNYNDEEFKKKCNFTRIKIIEEIDRVKEEEEKKKAEEEQKKKEEEEKKKNEEKKEEGKIEGAVYIPPKRPRTPPKIEEMSLIPEIIIKYEFNQKIKLDELIFEENDKSQNNNIIFTKNNAISVDLDEYFEESFNILKKNCLIKEEKKEEKKEVKEENREVDDEDEIEDNNLIDELFNEIGLDEEEKGEEKKEEEKKEEEKKEDEKKEEVKKDEDKKEEEKKEEVKKEEVKKEEVKKE